MSNKAEPLSWPAAWNEFNQGRNKAYGTDYFYLKAGLLGAKLLLGFEVFTNKRAQEISERTKEVFDTAIRTFTIAGIQRNTADFYTAARDWIAGGEAAQSGDRTWKVIHKGFCLAKESGYFINLFSFLTIIPTFKNVGFLIHGAGIVKELMSSYENIEYLIGKEKDPKDVKTQKNYVALAGNVTSIAVSVLTIHNLLLGAGVMLSIRGVRFLAQKEVSKLGIDAIYLVSHSLFFFNKVYSIRWEPVLNPKK